jgi:hypothetical protein
MGFEVSAAGKSVRRGTQVDAGRQTRIAPRPRHRGRSIAPASLRSTADRTPSCADRIEGHRIQMAHPFGRPPRDVPPGTATERQRVGQHVSRDLAPRWGESNVYSR